MEQKHAPDIRIAEHARRQHGAVSITQLRAAGLSDAAVTKRCRSGRLHRLHRGVYAVGHIAASSERRWMAAVLALGDGAALSHRSAAELWGLLPTQDGPIDVSLPSRSGRLKRRGIRVHRPRALVAKEITRRSGIPITSPARTLTDLRRAVPARESRRAIRQAEFLGLAIDPVLEPDRTRSELEYKFLRLCRLHRLPAPAVNLQVGPFTVDFCWVEQRLIVETDGYTSHRGREAFEIDRARDLRLRALGYQVQRLSYRQVVEEPERVADVLRALLMPSIGAAY
jgi:very-short-patch-repair endonuclease